MIIHVAACRIDIAIIVDCSGSIRDLNPPGVDNWQYIIDFMVDLVTSINVGKDETHVGAVSFGRKLELYRHFYAINNTTHRLLETFTRKQLHV